MVHGNRGDCRAREVVERRPWTNTLNGIKEDWNSNIFL